MPAMIQAQIRRHEKAGRYEEAAALKRHICQHQAGTCCPFFLKFSVGESAYCGYGGLCVDLAAKHLTGGLRCPLGKFDPPKRGRRK